MNKVFISYASEDLSIALKLHKDLLQNGIESWLDEFELLPGMNWNNTILDEIDNCSFFMMLLSHNSINKEGYLQKEIKHAFERYQRIPENQIFIIPVRIENVTIHNRLLNTIQFVDIFDDYYEYGLSRIIKSIKNSDKYLKNNKKTKIESTINNGINILKNNNFQQAYSFFLNLIQSFPNNEEIKYFYCFTAIAGKQIYSIQLEIIDEINNILINILDSKDENLRYKIFLLLGIIRYDYYKKKKINYIGVKSEEIFQILENKIPNKQDIELFKYINMSQSTKILFNINF